MSFSLAYKIVVVSRRRLTSAVLRRTVINIGNDARIVAFCQQPHSAISATKVRQRHLVRGHALGPIVHDTWCLNTVLHCACCSHYGQLIVNSRAMAEDEALVSAEEGLLTACVLRTVSSHSLCLAGNRRAVQENNDCDYVTTRVIGEW